MKALRPVVFALLLFGLFYYLTTHGPGGAGRLTRPATLQLTEAAAPPEFDAEERNNIEIYRRVLPSVVNITSTTVAFDFFYRPVPQRGQGSGFLIDQKGHILTNYHVVADARQIEVSLHDRRRLRAELVGADPSQDLAVLRIAADNLSPVTLGDSQHVVVGQKVIAIGNPFGLEGTMTTGIVSSIRSVRTPEESTIDEAIQTDAAINPGNSGGPLLNARGEVIGINLMIAGAPGVAQSAGIGFAIPVNAAKAVLEDLITIGRVRRPALGVATLPVSPELARELELAADYGALIVQVVPGSAAERAGLRGGTRRAYLGNIPITLGGDLIVAINGEEVREQQDLARIMRRLRAGDTVSVTAYRGRERRDFQVTLQEARDTRR
jgi:S1-C subfamily serine protease